MRVTQLIPLLNDSLIVTAREFGKKLPGFQLLRPMRSTLFFYLTIEGDKPKDIERYKTEVIDSYVVRASENISQYDDKLDYFLRGLKFCFIVEFYKNGKLKDEKFLYEMGEGVFWKDEEQCIN